MISPRESFEAIAGLLERAQTATDARDVQAFVISAHTHAILQASSLRRREAYAERLTYAGPLQ